MSTKPRVFTVTAGHGGNDPGAVATHNGVLYKEADMMTNLRHILAVKLRQLGHTVREDGTNPLLNLPLAHALLLVPGSCLSLELHTNSFTNPSATGVEVVSLPNRKEISQRVASAIATTLDLPLRGDKGWIDQTKTARGRLGFVRAGGLVVETFFISNPRDVTAYESKKWLVASAVAKVLDEFAASK